MTKAPVRLVLPKAMVQRLQAAGVYCQTWVTLAKQARTGQWVLRGIESGGSSREVGRYISFFSRDGGRLSSLQRLDRIGSNGVHAVVVAPELISVEMARVDQTYQLLIVRHCIDAAGERARVVPKILFRGIDGQLSPELLKQGLAPEFFTSSGEVKPIPWKFLDAIKLVTAGVSCVNCRHCHGLLEPAAVAEEPKTLASIVEEDGNENVWFEGVPFPFPGGCLRKENECVGRCYRRHHRNNPPLADL